MKSNLPDGLYAAFDLGTQAIKAAIIERSAGQDRIAALEEEQLHPPAEFPGEDQYRDHQVKALQALAERLPLKQCRQSIALFNHRELQVKIVDLPAQVGPGQVEGILSWEAKKLLSPTYRSEPYLFAWRPLRPGNPSPCVLVVIPLSHLQRFIDLFNAAGIPLHGAYPEALTGLGIKEGLPTAGLPALSLINVGHISTHIHIFAGGELKFYRHIPSGMGEIPEGSQPSELEGYTQKIRFSFDYFRAVTKLGTIDEILFLGGGARRPGFLPFARTYFAPGRCALLDLSSRFDIAPVVNRQGEDGSGLCPFHPTLATYLAHSAEAPDAAGVAGGNFIARLHRLEHEERWARLGKTLPVAAAAIGLVLLAVVTMVWRTMLDGERRTQATRISQTEAGIGAARIKLARRQKTAEPSTNFPPRERKLLAPMLRQRLGIGEILFLEYKFRPAGVQVFNLELLPAGTEPTPEPETGDSQEPAMGDASQGSSGLPQPSAAMSGSPSGQEAEVPSNLGGEVLFIRGICQNADQLLTYTEMLRARQLVRRFLEITTRKADGKVWFQMKGERP